MWNSPRAGHQPGDRNSLRPSFRPEKKRGLAGFTPAEKYHFVLCHERMTSNG